MIRDLREYTRNTQTRLIIGFLALAFLVGVGLIYLFYGKEAALLGSGMYGGRFAACGFDCDLLGNHRPNGQEQGKI